MAHTIVCTARVPAWMQGQVESLLFFNLGQERIRDEIAATIERYGIPELVAEDGWLRVDVAGVSDVQTLYAMHEEDARSRAVGVVVYAREGYDRFTVLHVGVADDYAQGGPYASERVLSRLLQQIRHLARQTAGVRHVEVAYRRNRLRAARAMA